MSRASPKRAAATIRDKTSPRSLGAAASGSIMPSMPKPFERASAVVARSIASDRPITVPAARGLRLDEVGYPAAHLAPPLGELAAQLLVSRAAQPELQEEELPFRIRLADLAEYPAGGPTAADSGPRVAPGRAFAACFSVDLAHRLDPLVDPRGDQLEEKLVLAGEIRVHRAFAEARRLGHPLEARALVAALREYAGRRRDEPRSDLFPLLAPPPAGIPPDSPPMVSPFTIPSVFRYRWY